MTEILKIRKGEEPSPYSNYVLIQMTATGTYRVSGASNKNGAPERLASPHFGDLGEAVKAAAAWALEHGIKLIHAEIDAHHGNVG